MERDKEKLYKELNSLKNNVRVHKDGNQYFCILESFPLISSGKTLEEAYANLSRKKDGKINQIIELNQENLLLTTQNMKHHPAKNPWSDLYMFVAKCFISVMIFLLIVSVGGFSIYKGVKKSTRRLKASITKASPEKQQERILRFRKALTKLKPYLKEIDRVVKTDGKGK